MVKKSAFDLSHTRSYTHDMGTLIPSCLIECMPGDHFKLSQDQLLRLSPQLAPIMHEVMVINDWFFIPFRILQSDWANFITHGVNGNDTTPPPTMASTAGTGYTAGSLADYLGLPLGIPGFTHSAMPFRAYQMIYNEYYRDQNLNTAASISAGNGLDITTSKSLQNRCWEKDYFTSALSSTQRGSAVTLPTGVSAPVKMVGGANGPIKLYQSNGTIEPDSGNSNLGNSGGNLIANTTGHPLKIDPVDTLYADLSASTAVSINDLRSAFQLQKWKEKSLRGGSRLVETIKEFFGAKLPDYTAQRPQLIGRNFNTVLFSEVLQTSEQNTTPQGNMAGHAIMAQKSNSMRYNCVEHGLIMCITTVMPRTQYQQGIPRMYLRQTYLDYPWPTFAHLGEQAIQNQELFAASASPTGTFGYTPRYQEFRLIENSVHGQFRKDQGLDYWNMARQFLEPGDPGYTADPALNSDFVTCNPRKDMFAVQDEHVCYMMQRNNVFAIRPIPKHGIPGYVDHD